MKEEKEFQLERQQMVEQQLLGRDIRDERVLDAMRKVPRHLFVPSDHQHLAYRDGPLPIGQEQTISQPYIVALMTQMLALDGVTSVQFIMKDLNNKMLRGQVPTQVLAFMIIGGLIYLALKKVSLVVIALTPIFITIILLYGYLALTHIPLNLFSILMFSISIGIGIDYAIHFVSVWHTYKKLGKSVEESIEMSYAYTSRPILANALGLSIGMSALLLSPLKIHTYLSLVMWFTMVMSVILTLTLLPTLLKKRVNN